MLQPNLAISTAVLVMLAACVLGIAFSSIPVFVALVGENSTIPVKHKIRPLEIREREVCCDS